MDESRFGLKTIVRRRLTLPGIKPIGIQQHDDANLYVYGLVAPATGEGFFAARRSMGATDVQSFLDRFVAQRADHFHIIILDNAKSHHAKTLKLPKNVALLFLPPYSPELNPCERVWLAIKDHLAWATFPDLVALQDKLAELFEQYDQVEFHSLIAYPFLCDPIARLAA
jgi:hypothetical protein